MILTILDDVAETFWKIIISLVGSIFKLVNSAYRIFLALAEADIFKNAEFDIITKNMYEILSIVMLFALAYGILVKIVDPENSKSGVDGKKILQKLVMAIILLALIPSIFSFMFGLQEAILESNVLNSIFTGSSNVGAQNIKNAGNVMAVNSFKPFFTPNVNSDVNPEEARGSITNHTEYGITLGNNGSYGCKKDQCTLADVDTFAEKTGDFGFYQAFAANINEGEVDFQWLIALIVGGFLVYAMISFCFDMALRVCKLAFFEIIAPIAIFCNVIPKMEDVFKKWLSNTTKTFISVFTRIIVMNFGVYLISIIVNNADLGLNNAGNWFLNLIAKCFLILGIVMFMRQAPKLLSDLFGFGDGDMKLGIRDKLKSSGAFVAGAAIGGATTGLVRNATNAVQQFRKAPKEKKFSAALKGFGSAAAGAASGLTKGAWYAKGAGSGKDMKNAASQAANKTVENRMKRDNYTAAHSRGKGWLDDRVQNIIGHAEDTGVKVAGWAGYKNIAQLKLENAAMDEITSARDTFDSDVDSYIEKELAKVSFNADGSIKEGSVVGVSDTSVGKLHIAQEKLNKARVSGVGVAEAQKEYLDILKEARYGVQDIVLCSTKNWNDKSDKDKAKLGSLRVDAVKYKGSIANNADLDPLKQAGIIGADFSQDVDLTLSRQITDDAGNVIIKDIEMIDNMNNNIKISKNNNKVEIATREQKKQEDSKK